MIVIDYSQVSIGTMMAESKGRSDIEISLPLLRHMILNTIRSYRMKFKNECGEVVIACDGRKYWRKDEFPFYKAGRKKGREDSGLNWEEIFKVLNQVKNELNEIFPYPVIEVHGAEADDIIATLATWSQSNDLKEGVGLFEESVPKPFMIVSGDHDFKQLQKYSNVKQFSPITKAWVKVTESPEHFLQEHIIQGDKGDGVPNIFSSDDTFVTESRQKPIKKKNLEVWKTQNFEEFCTTDELTRNYQRNRRLIDLSYTPERIQREIVESYISQANKHDRSKILSYFISNKMRNMIDVITDF
jgi:hypothetical protein